jgi:hypothetical protein
MSAARCAVIAVLALAAAGAGACKSVSEPVSTGPTVTLNSTSLFLSAGDSAPLIVGSPVEGTVRWKSSNPAIVTVDSLVFVGDPAWVRARSTGSTVLTGVIVLNGQTINASVPVRVGAG